MYLFILLFDYFRIIFLFTFILRLYTLIKLLLIQVIYE